MSKRFKTIFFALLLCRLCVLGFSFGDGAVWIGPADNQLPFHAHTLPVFRIDCDFEIGDSASTFSIIYGMNDERLMNASLNVDGMLSPRGGSYIKVTVGADSVTIYRAGYSPEDNPHIPLYVFRSPGLQKGGNRFRLMSNLGYTDIFINDKKAGYAALNPAGCGGDHTAYPMLADMMVEIEGNAWVRNLTVRNFREPSNVLAVVDGPINATQNIDLPRRSMPSLRRRFALRDDAGLKSALVTATARGIYDLYVNGRRVNDEFFLPGWTQYNRTHLYHTFDITDFLTAGYNELRVDLGEGWWSGGATYSGENWNFYGDRQSFIGNVAVEYADGSTDIIVTEPAGWEVTTSGPVITGSFFQGEIYDRSKSLSADSIWTPAVEITTSNTASRLPYGWNEVELRPSYSNRVEAFDTLTAVAMTQPRDYVFVYDLGQNIAGVPCIDVASLAPGDTMRVRYAEMLYPELAQYAGNIGMIMTENLRAAHSTDVYIAGEENAEPFVPRFTFHGFRYIEITGLKEPPALSDVKAVSLSSIHNIKAHYECSDTLVNKLWSNILRSTLSNFISVPTDCPQRNERLGWMGDISVFSPAATKIADVEPVLRQYLQSVRDCQSADGRFPDVAPTGYGFGGLLWGSAGITVPWELYKATGDTAVIAGHYPAMARYIDYVMSDCIDPSSGIIVQNHAWGDLGDWLSPQEGANDKSLLWECYLIYDLRLLSKMAAVVGRGDDAERYARMADARTRFFRDTYIDSATSKTRYSAFDADRQGGEVDTQASYALAVALVGIADEGFVENFVHSIERENRSDNGKLSPPYSLMTGFIGTAWICDALSRIGRQDIAYRMLQATDYPSWLYPVTQGATTIWERLDSYTHTDGFGDNNSMNSFNHYSFGAVADWLLQHSLGIQVDVDGRVSICPEIDSDGGITYARGWLDTRAGRIYSAWTLDGGVYSFDINLPGNVEAEFLNPVTGERQILRPGLHHIESPVAGR